LLVHRLVPLRLLPVNYAVSSTRSVSSFSLRIDS
jgi:hypothetical protein